MIRKIITFPDPILRKEAKPVTVFDEALKVLATDMAETMYKAPGVGLAAPQIGVSQQIIVYDLAPEGEKGQCTALINPNIVEGQGKAIDEEGCLSVREFSANVERFEWVRVEAATLDGKPLNFEAEGYHARVLQHEIDHLHGVLFIDHLSSLKRTLYKKKLKKILMEDKENES
ncbi:MAG: peptide deformylase [Proteobacteria bacterium]|nr:peptide deformylase [Pseudomonadota bacterium]MBU1686065.1 peptide deformylase [Pseudomonadota bacterium]